MKIADKIDVLLDIFTSKNRHSIYPRSPYRLQYPGRYGSITIGATCGDAYAYVSLSPAKEDLIKKRWPICRRKPDYPNAVREGDMANTEKKEIEIAALEERLADIKKYRPENPFMTFRGMVKYYRDDVKCIATVEQVSRLVAAAKKLNAKTVTLYCCTLEERQDMTYAKLSFNIDGFLSVGLIVQIFE